MHLVGFLLNVWLLGQESLVARHGWFVPCIIAGFCLLID
jgi:hypothetical protein